MMANRFFTPNQQFCDNTGTPYAGGSLSFYASGTSTPLATYSNQALSIANTNPVVLDSAGRAGNVFLQNLAYKLVLSDSNSNIIWTADPVYASDYSTVASFFSGSGSPNSTQAGTQGTATIPASVYWDYTNNILYVCTTTGTSSTAVWTAVNAATTNNSVPPPQGRLTLTSGTPIISSDVTAATTVYFTPYRGNQLPVYNGSTFASTVFSEISLALVSQHAASTMYDVFVFSNSGVLTLVTGPAWSNSGSGTGARGSGAGTTQLSLLSGLWVNTVQMSGRNGSTTYTVPASQGTYLGSIFINPAAGTVSCTPQAGQTRIWGVWNAYNRAPIILQCVDPTSSWNNTSGGTIVPANNFASANGMTAMTGLSEELYKAQVTQNITQAAAFPGVTIGIGWNSTSAYSGIRANDTPTTAGTATFTGRYNQAPTLGKHVVTPLESSGTSTPTFLGTSTNFLATVEYQG